MIESCHIKLYEVQRAPLAAERVLAGLLGLEVRVADGVHRDLRLGRLREQADAALERELFVDGVAGGEARRDGEVLDGAEPVGAQARDEAQVLDGRGLDLDVEGGLVDGERAVVQIQAVGRRVRALARRA